jgi:hypothetical protein
MDNLEKLQNAARFRRLSIRISNKAARILGEIAETELRTPQQQAAFMLERALRELETNPNLRITYIPIAEEL